MNFLNIKNPGFSLFGWHITWYGVIITFSMFVAMWIILNFSKTRKILKDDILGIAICAIPLCIISARLYYVLFSGKSYSFIEFFQIEKGGMAIFGGIIGGAIGALIYCLIRKKNFLNYSDVIVPGLIMAQSIARWGNFINQEAYGGLVENAALHWFPISVYIESESAWHMATFFYESLWDLLVFMFLIFIFKNTKKRGLVTFCYMALYGFGRAIIEGFRLDSLRIPGTAIRISQIISIAISIIGITMIFIYCIKEVKKRKNIVDKS